MREMPGAAGMVAANYLYNIARHDGSEIGMVGRGAGIEPLLAPKDKAQRYVASRFNWIGTPQQEVGLVLARQPSPIATMADLKQHELIVSGTTSIAAPSYYPRLMNKLFGTRFKVVEGYKSSQEALLALERGEVDGHCSGSSSATLRQQIAPSLAVGKVKILAQIGREQDPDYPDIPLILNLAPTQADRQVTELALMQQVMAWPVVAPPDVPPDRVKALRDAFEATMQDADFPGRGGAPEAHHQSGGRREDRRAARAGLCKPQGYPRSRRRAVRTGLSSITAALDIPEFGPSVPRPSW
jgi:tripartite-type tricarboxylate transporter receptor subunit TctC